MTTTSAIARAQLGTGLHLLATIMDEAASGMLAWEGTENGDQYIDLLESVLSNIRSFPSRPFKTPKEPAAA